MRPSDPELFASSMAAANNMCVRPSSVDDSFNLAFELHHNSRLCHPS